MGTTAPQGGWFVIWDHHQRYWDCVRPALEEIKRLKGLLGAGHPLDEHGRPLLPEHLRASIRNYEAFLERTHLRFFGDHLHRKLIPLHPINRFFTYEIQKNAA